jgi:glycosyltransferase involved in cell wall biosynthesis
VNIGLITPYYPDENTLNSGIANHFYTLANALAKQGHQITVIHVRSAYLLENDTFKETLVAPSVTLIKYSVFLPDWLKNRLKNKWAALDLLIKLKSIWLLYKNLDNLKKKYKLDVAETTSYFSLCYGYLRFKKPGLPTAVRVSTTYAQIMNDYYPFKSKLLTFFAGLEIKLIRKSRFLVTHACQHALEMSRLYNIPPEKFVIIPHATLLPAIADLKENSGLKKVLFVGRLEYRKGIDVLLEAIPLVIDEFEAVTFELIGSDADGNYENNFRENNTEVVNNLVKFSGALSNSETYKSYAACDIFVAPSRYESFGLIYIEAMSFGKPVIGCRVGGVSEIIEDNQNGLFTKTGDPLDLAEKILFLLRHDAERKRMGLNARQTVEQKFTVEKLAERSVAFYQKILAA